MMNFSTMKVIEPELGRLQESARFAGRHGATWPATWAALYEPLSKAAGRGAFHEELQTATAYEVARRAIYRAWQGEPADDIEPATWPWEAVDWGEGDTVEQYA